MNKITQQAQDRCAQHTLQDQLAALREQLTPDQHIAHVEHLLTERRKRTQPVGVERRGRNPQRRGFEDQRDVDFAFKADRDLDEKDD